MDSPEGIRHSRPFLLFATPRSGSWPVYQTLLAYFEQTQGAEGLGELFNLDYQSFSRNGDQLVTHYFPAWLAAEDKARARVSVGAQSLIEGARTRRWELIAPRPERYFFKVFPSQLGAGNEVPLCKHHDWIFLERRDLYSQLLSFLISSGTDTWYQEGGLRVAPGSLSASAAQLEDFERMIWSYTLQKKRQRPARVIYYEDFCRLAPEDFLRAQGFACPVDLSGLKLPDVQNPGSKEAAFANLGEIREWYRGSALQALCPIA